MKKKTARKSLEKNSGKKRLKSAYSRKRKQRPKIPRDKVLPRYHNLSQSLIAAVKECLKR